jgi:TatD DNase family protein
LESPLKSPVPKNSGQRGAGYIKINFRFGDLTLIDIHAHLCFPNFEKDLDEVVERCRQEIDGVVVSSARYEEGLKVLELCKKNPGFLFPTLGYHPTEGTNPDGVLKLIRENRYLVVGVGEVGLDYHWETDSRKRKGQEGIFRKFIELAKEIKKPLVIHSWDAERECFDMVKDSGLVCIFHCFSGDRELAGEILHVPDFYISISTQVIFNKSIRKLAKKMPLERLLLETDAPFLSPVKGERNFPWNITRSAEKIAELRDMDSSEILNAARENAVRVFGLKLKK